MKNYALLVLATIACTCVHAQKLKVGPDYRFLTYADGRPFVWIGDTHWFFARLPPATLDSLLDKRATQGYTVMFVSAREELYDGQGDPGTPPASPNEAWWAYLDEYIEKCGQRGMYVGITLGWYRTLNERSIEELYAFGRRAGERYADTDNIVWLTLGEAGSHLRKDTVDGEKLAALVRGIREGDTGGKLLTVHADYQRATSLTDDALLCDFNNWQTSQWVAPDSLPRKDERHWTAWEAIAYDYDLRYDGRPKPTFDSEAMYERNKRHCDATPFVIRRRAWFTILAGGFGHTYGAGGAWDGLPEPTGCSGSALDAVHYMGAAHIGHLSTFLHDLEDELLQLRPAQELIASNNSDSYDYHLQAARSEDGSFVVVYSASDGVYELDLSSLGLGRRPKLSWFNPRSGEYLPGGRLGVDKVTQRVQVDPPGTEGPGNDWVLRLD